MSATNNVVAAALISQRLPRLFEAVRFPTTMTSLLSGRDEWPMN
jgi:hypothetical protein